MRRRRPQATPEQREFTAGMIAGLLSMFGMGVQLLAARKSDNRDWVPTNAEQQAMAQPLTNIALRHSPADELGEATDLVDGVGVAVAGLGYALRAGSGAPGGLAEQGARPTSPIPPPEDLS